MNIKIYKNDYYFLNLYKYESTLNPNQKYIQIKKNT